MSKARATAQNKGYGTYSEVPFYRKNGVAILSAIIFWPALLVILLSGDVYYERKGELRTYGLGAKIFLIIWCLIMSWSFMQPTLGNILQMEPDHTSLFNSCVKQFTSGKISSLLSPEVGDKISECMTENSQFDMLKVDYARLDNEAAKTLYNQVMPVLERAKEAAKVAEESLRYQNQFREEERAKQLKK